LIDPPVLAFRRRASELRRAALWQRQHDLDSGALLLFYAAECALKFLYMSNNMLRSAAESRASIASVKDLGHDLVRIIDEIKIPRSSLPSVPLAKLQRTGSRCPVAELHQAWRYGEKLIDSQITWDWLLAITNYCEKRS
jgi:hypothetical protein